MKGSARVVGRIRGGAYAVGQPTANAVAFGVLNPGKADAVGLFGGKAGRTRDTGLSHFLYVEPKEPQELLWLVPQVGIDYTITTSTNLNWQIQ